MSDALERNRHVLNRVEAFLDAWPGDRRTIIQHQELYGHSFELVHADLAAICREVRELRKARASVAYAYQICGSVENVPVELLDNLSDLAQGEPIRHPQWPKSIDAIQEGA